MKQYILGIDQSTQGTKTLLFDEKGKVVRRAFLPHRQIVNENGWVEHDPEEIYENLLRTVRMAVDSAGIEKDCIAAVGISTQRETTLAWDREGKPVCNAVVWQCARAEALCEEIREKGAGQEIKDKTGIPLSPYFSAAKLSWILRYVKGARETAERGGLLYGTMDSFLIYRLTKGRSYKTDYSNASRTQYFNIREQKWDSEICRIFGILEKNLPQVADSDGNFGETDFEGYLEPKAVIHGVLGDSHAALFAQGCFESGRAKATYGTGASVMMNTGANPVFSSHGAVTSIGWRINGITDYVLEGNINYAGAVITWLKEDLRLIASAKETEKLAFQADLEDHCYLIPAFTGLGAPYWDGRAEAAVIGMTRHTGRAEIVRAALESIAYQITDVIKAMESDMENPLEELRVDGGATDNGYLMQFQCDLMQIPVRISQIEELSAMGAAYAAGLGAGVYEKESVFCEMDGRVLTPEMDPALADKKYNGWKSAVNQITGGKKNA